MSLKHLNALHARWQQAIPVVADAMAFIAHHLEWQPRLTGLRRANAVVTSPSGVASPLPAPLRSQCPRSFGTKPPAAYASKPSS